MRNRLIYRYSRRLSIIVIELNWRLKILFDMYDQRQCLLIVNIVIYLIKTIKDILIEEKMIHFLNVIFFFFFFFYISGGYAMMNSIIYSSVLILNMIDED